jgi:hypothetical protein
LEIRAMRRAGSRPPAAPISPANEKCEGMITDVGAETAVKNSESLAIGDLVIVDCRFTGHQIDNHPIDNRQSTI